MSILKEFYKKYSETVVLNVWVGTGFGSALLFLKTTGEPDVWTYVVGVGIIFLITVHGYLLKSVKDKKNNKMEYLQRRINRQSWLINSLNSLVKDKTILFKKYIGEIIPDGQREESIRTTLQMLYEFYSRSDFSTEPSGIRIIFQEPRNGSTEGESKYLTLTYFYFGDGRSPEYEGDEVKEKQYFSYDRCPTGVSTLACPVAAWTSGSIVIYSNPKEIPYFSDGQRENVKSLLSYPVKGDSDDHIVGIITISSNMSNFFMKEDIKEHRKYIKEFGDRIVMELAAMEMKRLREAS